MKKKKKHKKSYMYRYGMFAPIFPLRSSTPRTTPNPSAGGAAPAMGPSGGVSPGSVSAGGGTSMGDSIVHPSRRRVVHEMRIALGVFSEDSSWLGYGMGAPMLAAIKAITPGANNMRTGTMPGSTPVADPKNSPGFGFRTEAANKIWRAAVDIMDRDKTLPMNAIIQAAMLRAGVRYQQIDAGESRLLEMGIEWYLSGAGQEAQKQARDSLSTGSEPIGAGNS